jgi:hypothetical protein
MTSMFSISSGLMSSRRDGPLPPVPTPAVPPTAPGRLFVDDVMRTPSMMTIGSLVSESDAWPRMRMREPEPVAPPLTTCTPAARPLSSWPMLDTGASAMRAATGIVATALATSTRRWAPVAVTTTSESARVVCVSATSAVAVCPAVRVTVTVRAV